jgi:hypothetical protein
MPYLKNNICHKLSGVSDGFKQCHINNSVGNMAVIHNGAYPAITKSK